MKNIFRRLTLYQRIVGSPLYLQARAIVVPPKTVRIQQKIRAALGRQSDVFFVQVGSNDGGYGDPLRDFILSKPNWHGIFVEPVTSVFERLKRNYGASPRFVFENIAVGDMRGTTKFFYVSERAKELGDLCPVWYDQLGSFNRDHITKHLDGILEPYIVEEQIAVSPLSDILERNGVSKIDLVHIDTEGFDFHVLSQLNLKRFRPKVVLFERCHLTAAEVQRSGELLTSNGYCFEDISGDRLAIRVG